MDFCPHSSRTSREKHIRKSFFIIVKSYWHNGNLMIYCQSESTIFKSVQNNRSIIWHSSLGKNANTDSLIQSVLRPLENLMSAFLISTIDQNTSPFIKEPKKWNFGKLFFPHKNERIIENDQHQHNICHRRVVGHKHVTFLLIQSLLPFYQWHKTHSVENNGCPYFCQDKKIRIPLFLRR